MPIRKDETGKRWVEMEIITPGTPEQVWQAMATGVGNTAWFTKANVDERVGGEIRFDFGATGSSVGEVTAWEPPHRFAYVERDWSPGAPPVATEITITSRTGDRCVVRMVHSLFASSEEWDDQMEGFEKGWPAFFDVLRIYLARFAGQKAGSFVATGNAEGDHLAVWKRLTEQLDLVAPNAGERRTTAPRPEQLSGVIERVQQQNQERILLMRVESPGPGVALIWTQGAAPRVNVGVNLYFYGDDAVPRAATSESTWRGWLEETFSAGVA
jgi:uncharacterized protein YndB with AHSA1/START domain